MTDDLYLDDADDPRSKALTEDGNAEVRHRLHDATFEADVARVTEILEDDETLYICRRRGGRIYHFRRSAGHPRGVWRRLPGHATPSAEADWEPVFDLDAYCRETGHEWAWRGPVDGPDPSRVLLVLSDNGSDICTAREFDLETKAFVEDGFRTPPARLSVAWDGPDALLVAAATGPDHATRSGWPRTVRLWERDRPFEEAPVLWRTDHDDLLAHGQRIFGTGVRVFRTHHTIQHSSLTIERGGVREAADLPREAWKGASDEWLVWKPLEDGAHRAGSLVLRRHDGPPFERVLFEPGERSAVEGFYMTRRWLFLQGHDDLRHWLRVLSLDDPEAPLTEVPIPHDATALSAFWHAADPDLEDDPRIEINTQTMLRPPTLARYDPRNGSLVEVAREKPTFDAGGMRTELLHARSADGTMVPYHVALPRGAGPVPMLIWSYGGFGMSVFAWYQKFHGPTLLARGIGVVTAHIRGGGEFGPDWHRVAMAQGRHKAFEDCVAVARDLVERGLAPAGGVGFHGQSNGGLLAAVMATRYPDDFGAIKADVPVADMLRFHLYEAGAAWIEEYGDPDDAADGAYLRAYSPVHNVPHVSEARMPPVLIDAPLHDDRVDPAHARRFARRLRDAGQDAMLRTSQTGGHGGGETSHRQAEDAAIRAAFFRHTLKGVDRT